MELIKKSVTEYVQSGEYFIDARDWYHRKYIFPVFERSIISILLIFILLLCIGLFLNVYYLFPLKIHKDYIAYIQDAGNKTPGIIRASSQSTELQSINAILVQNYVLQFEKYDYENIKQQLIYLKNNSTKILFKKFYDSLVLSNPNSIILRYRKDTKRFIKLRDMKFLDKNIVSVKFNSKAITDQSEVVEDKEWEATLNFESDEINPSAPPETRFGFLVTDYNVKLLKNNIQQKE